MVVVWQRYYSQPREVETACATDGAMNLISKITLTGVLALFGTAVLPARDNQQNSSKQDMQDAGHDTKQAAKDVFSATKSAAKSTGKAVKKGTNKAARKTEQGAAKLKNKTSSNSDEQSGSNPR